jgi:hypothetical protein
LRARTARPHWLLIDEAHHLLPAARADVSQVLPEEIPAAVFITVHPELVSADALKTVRTVIALGDKANEVVAVFCKAIGMRAPERVDLAVADEVLFWTVGSNTPRAVQAERPRQAHKRHTRKYAEETGSTMPPGSITCAPVTIRRGFATSSRTTTWRRKLPKSKPIRA